MSPDKSTTGLKRRDALKLLGAAPAALATLNPTLARAQDASQNAGMAPSGSAPAAADTYQPKALNAHQYRLLTVLSALIIPADERTGSAVDAGAPACVDDWLTIRGQRLLTQIQTGLAWLDAQAGGDFASASLAQQKAVLDRIAYPLGAAPEDRDGALFFSRMRDLVVEAFYSSEMGVKDLQYLGNTMVMHWQGCPDNVLTQLKLSGYAENQWQVPFPAARRDAGATPPASLRSAPLPSSKPV